MNKTEQHFFAKMSPASNNSYVSAPLRKPAFY
jgi:hypothetical protein